MKTTTKTIISVFMMLILVSAIDAQTPDTDKNKIPDKDKIIDGMNTTTDSYIQITGSPPWDSVSIRQDSNTNNVFMKVTDIPFTEWVDVMGYYNQKNYFQLPISVKLVTTTGSPVTNRNVYIRISEYKTWYEGGLFRCNCWKYQYVISYATTKNTGSTGVATLLQNIVYRGYDRTLYNIYIYTADASGKYTSYSKNVKVAWYINTG